MLVEAAANPQILADGFAPTPLGDKRTAGDVPLYRLARADLAVLDEQVWHLGPGPGRAVRADARARAHRPAPARDPARPGAGAGRGRPRRRRRFRRRRPRRAVPGAVPARARQRAPDQRGRPRAHRHRLAVAGARDDPQDRAHLRQRHRARQGLPGARLRLLAGPAVRLGEGAPAGDLPPDARRPPRPGQWAPVGGHVGRGRRQPARRRGAGPAARPSASGSSWTSSGWTARACGCPTRSATRRPSRSWPGWPGCAGSSPRRSPGTRPTGSRTTRSGGRASTAAGSSPTSRRPTPTTRRCPGAELAHAVAQLRREGRRHDRRCCRSATATAAAARPGRCWSGPAGWPTSRVRRGWRSSTRTRSSPRPSRSTPTPRSGPASSTSRLHRGTFTTQARTKAGNRRSERLLREAELWATAATVQRGADYPYERLDRLWKSVLLHQFHDILPGTSIAWVHREAGDRIRARSRAELEEIIADGGQRARRAAGRTRPGCSNTSPVRPRGGGHDSRAGPPHSRSAPASGVGHLVEPDGSTPPVTVSGLVLDNGLLRVVIDESGCLVLGAGPRTRTGRCSPAAVAATCCSCTRTCPTAGTPGTSTGTTDAAGRTSPTPRR